MIFYHIAETGMVQVFGCGGGPDTVAGQEVTHSFHEVEPTDPDHDMVNTYHVDQAADLMSHLVSTSYSGFQANSSGPMPNGVTQWDIGANDYTTKIVNSGYLTSFPNNQGVHRC